VVCSAEVSETVKKSLANWAWIIVPLVAAVEIVVQAYIPARVPTEDDWKQAADAIGAEKREHDLVVIAPAWAVQGRVQLGPLIPLEDLGRFDASRYDRLFEVSWRGARAPEAEGLEPESETVFGALTVRRYDLPRRAEVLYDLIDELDRCRAEPGPVPRPRALVDHWFGTRLVIPVKLRRRPAALTFEDVPLGTVLHGHGMIARLDYRKHALPEGDAVELAFSVDGEQVGTASIDNFTPLGPFEIALPGSGTGTLRIEISTPSHFERAFGLAADVRRARGKGDGR
jgi:hypothetical protein